MHSIARQKSRFVDCVVTVITQRVSATAERIARERCSFPEICNFVGTRSEKNTFFWQGVVCSVRVYRLSKQSMMLMERVHHTYPFQKGFNGAIEYSLTKSWQMGDCTCKQNNNIHCYTTRRGSWHFLRSYCRNNQDCLVTALPYTVGFNVSFSTI